MATISRRPIARQGPKFSTGGIPRDSQTARSLGPASLAASGVMRPQFSKPPEEHPAVSTMISRAISSLVSSTVSTSWPPAVRLEQPTTPATPLMSPDTIRSIRGCQLPPRNFFKDTSLTPVTVSRLPWSAKRFKGTHWRRAL